LQLLIYIPCDIMVLEDWSISNQYFYSNMGIKKFLAKLVGASPEKMPTLEELEKPLETISPEERESEGAKAQKFLEIMDRLDDVAGDPEKLTGIYSKLSPEEQQEVSNAWREETYREQIPADKREQWEDIERMINEGLERQSQAASPEEEDLPRTGTEG